MSNTYFILTRQIFDSAIWKHNPHVTRLFIYLVGMARHSKKPEHYSTFSIKRGEFVTSLTDIANANRFLERGVLRSWSKQKVGRMLETLQKEGYISLLSDTYGTHISVVNYDTYQDPSKYKVDTSGTGVEQVRNRCGTDVETNKKVKNDNNDKKKHLSELFAQFYLAYPKKVSKKKSEQSFMKLAPSDDLFIIIMDALETQKKAWNDPKYIPMPSTWINQARWEDETLTTFKPGTNINVYKNDGEDQYKDL